MSLGAATNARAHRRSVQSQVEEQVLDGRKEAALGGAHVRRIGSELFVEALEMRSDGDRDGRRLLVLRLQVGSHVGRNLVVDGDADRRQGGVRRRGSA